MKTRVKDGSGPVVSVRLTPEANKALLIAKDRSGRTKGAEVSVRLIDHLKRFPDFYHSDYVEVLTPEIK
ncbi:TraY domain-containing protein [Serratia fonticola]|uniref:TraY domain-containing protein n=1 Tax=Serratia fonticola TaxID=47917 RepID=UPI001377A082|nr:TraY domain-containing protein [Serratia fonticola]